MSIKASVVEADYNIVAWYVKCINAEDELKVFAKCKPVNFPTAKDRMAMDMRIKYGKPDQ